MELVGTAVAAIILVGGAFLAWKYGPAETDYVKPIAEHLRLRGEKVISHQWEGLDVPPLSRQASIRKYAVEIEMPNGERTTRLIGVQNALSDEPKFWRYGANGQRRPMF